jgi:hypothetical protein
MDHRRSLALVLAGALAGVILLASRGERPIDPLATREAPVQKVLEAPPERVTAVTVLPAPSPIAATTPIATPEEDLIAGPGTENHVPGAKPHPITPDHVRLQEEVALFKTASDALEARDVVEIRRLVREHRESYPDQNQDMADGYEILADCLEHPGAESTASAQRFFEEETYSMMRRPILRTCLDGQR